MTGTTSHGLWCDTSIFAARYAKTAALLAAVERVLCRRGLLPRETGEFSALLSDLRREALPHFATVLRDPYTYFWVRIAYELLGSALKGPALPPLAAAYCDATATSEPAAALASHLQDFKRIALGTWLLSGRDHGFTAALDVALPLAVPGTRLALTGSGFATILGAERGRVRVEADGREHSLPATPVGLADGALDGTEALRAVVCPMLDYAGCDVRLQPYAFHLPGLGFAPPVVGAGLAFQQRNGPLIASALALVNEYQPEIFAQFRELIRLVGLRRPEERSSRNNLSHSDLPGAMVVSIKHHPFYLAEVLVHELHHNRLFFLEDAEPLLHDEDAPLEAVAGFYSPWRPSGRPLHGILHGAYVHVPVCRFWLAVWRRGQSDEATLAMAADRLGRAGVQLSIATHQLRRYARFTEVGKRWLEQLERDVDAVRASIEDARVPADAKVVDCLEDGTVRVADGGAVTVRQLVRRNLEESELSDQARDILAHVPI